MHQFLFLGFAEAIIEIETTPDIALPQESPEQEYADDTFEQTSAEDVTENLHHEATEDTVAPDDDAPLTIDEGSR